MFSRTIQRAVAFHRCSDVVIHLWLQLPIPGIDWGLGHFDLPLIPDDRESLVQIHRGTGMLRDDEHIIPNGVFLMIRRL